MKIIISKRIIRQNIILLLLIAGVLMPDGISEIMPGIGTIWGIWRWGSCIFIVLYWLYITAIKKQLTISRSTMFFIGFFLYIAVVTFLKGASIVYLLSTYLPIVTVLFFYEICRKDLLNFFRVVEAYLIILALINLVLLIRYPNGMYVSASLMGYTKNWLFGYKSSFQFYLYPLLIIELFDWIYERNRFKSIGIIAVVIIEAFLCGNTMLLVVSMVVSFCVIAKAINITKICNPWVYGIVTLGLNWFFLSFQYRNSFFTELINKYLHKNADLTGRTAIWERTYSAIERHKLIGNGMVSPEIRKSMYQGIVHAHNTFLEIVYEGGVIWAILFICLLLYVYINIYKNIEIKSSKVYGICIFGLLIMGVFEVITHRLDAFFWVLLLTACDPRHIDNCYLEKSN